VFSNSQAQFKQKITKLQNELKRLTAADKLVQQHLITFDTLDYTVFSSQEWLAFMKATEKILGLLAGRTCDCWFG
jgi:archaellum biogenesis ATPase FlaH